MRFRPFKNECALLLKVPMFQSLSLSQVYVYLYQKAMTSIKRVVPTDDIPSWLICVWLKYVRSVGGIHLQHLIDEGSSMVAA